MAQPVAAREVMAPPAVSRRAAQGMASHFENFLIVYHSFRICVFGLFCHSAFDRGHNKLWSRSKVNRGYKSVRILTRILQFLTRVDREQPGG